LKKTICILLALSCLLILTSCRSLDAFLQETAPLQSAETSQVVTSDAAATTVTDFEITVAFEFGDRTGTYTGEMKGGLPDGQGTFSTQNTEGVGWVYDGGWRQGHMYGEGSTIFESGYSEAGWYENDNLNGQGQQFQDERLMYEGEFVQNVPEGQGTLYSYSVDTVYSGSFAQGYIDETEQARSERMSAVKKQCETVDYSGLYERAQNEDGSFVQLTGTVVYISGSDFDYESNFLIGGQSLSETELIQVHYRLSKGEEQVTEGEQVTVWAQVCRLSTSEAEDGTTVSFPTVEAWNVVDVSGTPM
jgi:hypothetical protein